MPIFVTIFMFFTMANISFYLVFVKPVGESYLVGAFQANTMITMLAATVYGFGGAIFLVAQQSSPW